MQVISALTLSSQRPRMEGRKERKANRAGKLSAAAIQVLPGSHWGLYVPDPSLGKQVEAGQRSNLSPPPAYT